VLISTDLPTLNAYLLPENERITFGVTFVVDGQHLVLITSGWPPTENFQRLVPATQLTKSTKVTF
jgi:hypothetical protein